MFRRTVMEHMIRKLSVEVMEESLRWDRSDIISLSQPLWKVSARRVSGGNGQGEKRNIFLHFSKSLAYWQTVGLTKTIKFSCDSDVLQDWVTVSVHIVSVILYFLLFKKKEKEEAGEERKEEDMGKEVQNPHKLRHRKDFTESQV